MRTAMLDLETSNLNADYGIILCGVFKPTEGKPVIFRIDKTSTYKARPWDDGELVKQIAKYIADNKIDILVTYNGSMFDAPFLNSRAMLTDVNIRENFIFKHIDLYWVARKKLRLHDAKLDTVARFLKCKVSKTHIDPELWNRAMTGDKKSLDYIVDHCVKDVIVLEEVYEHLKPFIKQIW
jgi:uncharacterized protein YprB with RNaseH-like and TPR domain